LSKPYSDNNRFRINSFKSKIISFDISLDICKTKMKSKLDNEALAVKDDIFNKIGEFGPYQLMVLVLIGLSAIIPATLAYSYVFIGATPEYR
jgi:hypothetical protein